jgi:hypothetical protein
VRALRPAFTILAILAFYTLVIRPRMLRWGATDDELRRPMPGDEIVERPGWSMTLATDIQATPEAVWPWLVQIGYQRGGLYSYDWLDRLFGVLDRPSADRILPEFQHLQAGNAIPLGAGPDWPVHAVEPNHHFVLTPEAPDFRVSWAFVLYPVFGGATRLVTRVRAGFAITPATIPFLTVLNPTAFAMTRKMLLGIKDRAESATLR